ncbi:FdtA/QdtA family cupin domain-containing protein [Salinimicrobium sp. 3283s]|uniref:sugar 3,4-ketoisomerase n=1 Tax=Salinimicrobium sp. 3283s TaxID=3114359 RepID=UPI0031EAB8C6
MIGKNSVYDCPVIPLNKIHSRAGNITITEVHNNIPFDIQRVYYLYDIPGGESRGGHAHKELYQIIVAVGGGFDILLDDGRNKKVVRLSRPDFGLMIVPGIWRELMDFTSGAVCMVMASSKYDEKDYIREYHDFQQLKK